MNIAKISEMLAATGHGVSDLHVEPGELGRTKISCVLASNLLTDEDESRQEPEFNRLRTILESQGFTIIDLDLPPELGSAYEAELEI